MKIHKTAIIHPSAKIDEDVEIGPYCVVGENVQIGKGTKLESFVVIECNTVVGKNCHLYSGVVLGGAPQDYKYKGEESFLIIGDNNIIREFVTIHRAVGEDKATRIGDANMFMAYAHIGHNCQVGNGVMLSNSVGVSGHVIIEDKVVVGGIVGIHQYVRIGKLAMVGGYSKVVQDVPPFMMVDGRPSRVYGINVVGLRRAGIPLKVRNELKQAYKLLYRSNLNISQAIGEIERRVDHSEELGYLLQFLKDIKFGVAGRQLERRIG